MSAASALPADDGQAIAPTGYDAHGCACYDDDLLDLRWGALVDDAPNGHDLEMGMHALIYTDDVDLIRKGIEILGLLAERHIRRLADPDLLDEESGRAWWRRRVVADLRSMPTRYDEMRERAGWPADPADLDDEQLGGALLVVRHPERLDELLEWRERWERPGD